MYVVAPTNRRPFGFDWEEWGRLNALATLDHAKETFRIDPSRVYATGHSMGGHGTWHLSVMHPGLFAALGPSAGWASFYTYGDSPEPPDWLEPARAHSDTYAYMSNLERRGAYILHGDADTNVPLSEGQALYDAITQYTEDVEFHIEPGADHWWDGDASEGQDCVDWPPMYEFFKERELDVTELDFEFRTPGQWIGAFHSYITLQSTVTPFEDGQFISEEPEEGVVELSTDNVRAFDVDADALLDRGVTELIVDGDSLDISGGGTVVVGPGDGKNKDAPGMLNPTFHRPFCLVYPDDEARVFRAFTAHLLSTWSLVGNGHGCALPYELLSDEIAEERNLIYVGFAADDIVEHEISELHWDEQNFEIADNTFDEVAGFTTFADGDHQGAAFFATEGAERLIFGHQPFSSRAGMGDLFVWTFDGGITGGFYDTSWEFDPALMAGGD